MPGKVGCHACCICTHATANATSVQDRQYTALLLLAHGLTWKRKVSTDGRDDALGWDKACICMHTYLGKKNLKI